MDANVNFRESITIEIIEVIWGKEERNKIEVFGSDGVDCRASVRHFNFGDYYIFSIYKLSKEVSLKSSETNNGYAIHGCGENYLKYNQENNTVFGRIKGKSIRKKNKIYSYKKFLEILK